LQEEFPKVPAKRNKSSKLKLTSDDERLKKSQVRESSPTLDNDECKILGTKKNSCKVVPNPDSPAYYFEDLFCNSGDEGLGEPTAPPPPPKEKLQPKKTKELKAKANVQESEEKASKKSARAMEEIKTKVKLLLQEHQEAAKTIAGKKNNKPKLDCSREEESEKDSYKQMVGQILSEFSKNVAELLMTKQSEENQLGDDVESGAADETAECEALVKSKKQARKKKPPIKQSVVRKKQPEPENFDESEEEETKPTRKDVIKRQSKLHETSNSNSISTY
jgi:hypothetical protein